MKHANAVLIIAVISVTILCSFVYLAIQYRSLEKASFEEYLYSPALLNTHQTVCAGFLRFSRLCDKVDEIAQEFDDLQATYEQRKLVYDNVKFLLTIEGKSALRKELRRELKAIRKLLESDVKQ